MKINRKTRRKNIRAEARHQNESIRMVGGDVVLAAAAGDGAAAGPRRFDVLAYGGGTLLLNNYDLPVVIDLATLKERNSLVANLDHERTKRVGNIDAVANDGKTLRLSGAASAFTPHRDEVINSANDGFRWQASVETSAGRMEHIHAGKKVSVNGQTFTGPILVSRGAVLKGFAFVSHGADDSTEVRIAAEERNLLMPPKFKAWLLAKNWDPDALGQEQLATLQAAFDREQNPDPTPAPAPQPTDLEAVIAAESANRDRIGGIARLTQDVLSRYPHQATEIEAMSRAAVESRESVRDYQCRLLVGVHPSTGQFRPRNNERNSDGVLEAALAISCKVDNIEARYSDQTLQAAHDQFKHGLGMAELLLMAASQRGHQRYSMHDTRSVLEAAFGRDRGDIHAAGLSHINVAGILSNVANKILLDSFNAVESEWRKIASIASVRDFKETNSYRLTGDLSYRELGPGGEIKYAKLGEENYGNKAKTYARGLSLDRTDLINDDLGAFRGIQKMLGRGGALAINRVFWTAFLDNAAFFSDDNNNLAAANFNAAGIDFATQLFALLTDASGDPLGVQAKNLLVPPRFKFSAKRLMGSQLTAEQSAEGTNNPYAGLYEVVSSVYLANPNIVGYDPDAYYLLANAEDVPVVEMCFLNGVETPTVESTDADFDVLGIKFRGIHDFGARKQDYRGGIKLVATSAEAEE